MSLLDWFSTSGDTMGGRTIPGDAAQADAQKSYLSDFMNTIADNRQSLMGFGLGLMSGDSKQDAYRNAALGAQRGVVLDAATQKEKKAEEEKKKRQAVYQQLAGKYGLPAEVAGDPELAQSAIVARLTPKEPGFEEKLYNSLPDPLKQQYRERFAKGSSDDPIAKRLAWGQATGLKGDELKRFALTGGLTELTKPLPAEQGARMGMADNFLSESKAARKSIDSGDNVGWYDRAQASMGWGTPGALERHIDSGKDALLRNLTGAGMNIAEAQQYVDRYSITKWDDKTTALDKYDRLVRELESIRNKTYEGRGEPPPITYKDSFGEFVGKDGQQAAPEQQGAGGGMHVKSVEDFNRLKAQGYKGVIILPDGRRKVM